MKLEPHTELAIVPIPDAQQGIAQISLSIEQVKANRDSIFNLMKSVMREDVHYGRIPGCGDKPTLLQPGAQALAQLFNCTPQFQIEKTGLERGQCMWAVTCRMVHRGTGQVVGEGVGICSTMEDKYRYRKAERVCPTCGKASIIKGREEYGGGWVCFKAKGGCGAKFSDGDYAIESQAAGRVEVDNPYDKYNTVQKIACKRAYVHAALNITAASELFTQDIEDFDELTGGHSKGQERPQPQPAQNHAPAASKPAAAPAQPKGPPTLPCVGVRNFQIAKSEKVREGKTPRDNRPWELFEITTSEGIKLVTFIPGVCEAAALAAKDRSQVSIAWKEGRFGPVIETLSPVNVVDPIKKVTVTATDIDKAFANTPAFNANDDIPF